TIITLVYLAIQIRENTYTSKRAVLDEHVDRVGRWMASVRADQESTALLIRGNTQFDTFSDDDKFRFHLMLAEFLIYCEAALDHAAADGLKSESAVSTQHHIRRLLSGDGAKKWWRDYGRKSFASDFSHVVDELIY
ncbi:MAG: hypothetical protein ABJP82_19365, partial [Hyphomicrobiales bacterium]